jgi:ribulose-phosphate 3-epimerase
MVTDPLAWIEPFVAAGADTVIFTLDAAADPAQVLRAIRACGKLAGVSLLITEPIDLLEPLWGDLDIVTVVGTAMGIKGAGLDPAVPEKIRQARGIIDQRRLKVEIQADGGIRRETVPLLAAAGADSIVPGSLMFKDDPAALMAWLATL